LLALVAEDQTPVLDAMIALTLLAERVLDLEQSSPPPATR
jgi:hypothetical protein